VFVLAFATSLAFGIDPGTEVYEQDRMRAHLVKCFRANSSISFLAVWTDFLLGHMVGLTFWVVLCIKYSEVMYLL